MTYHVENIGHYMQPDLIDSEHKNPEILIEFYSFLTEIKDDVLKDPENQKLMDIWYRLVGFLPDFLEHSKVKFQERFKNIVEAQRNQEIDAILEAQSFEKKRKFHKGQSNLDFQLMN